MIGPRPLMAALLAALIIAPLFIAAVPAQPVQAQPPGLTVEKIREDLEFNPFGYWKIRFAMQFLIDRQFIIDSIYEGSALPMLIATRPNHPGYVWVQDIPEEFGIAAVADTSRAQGLFLEAIDELNEIYREYGFELFFRDGFLWLRFPDGFEKQVVINGLMRTEDERLFVGRQVSDWIEKYFGVKVNRIERDRTVLIPGLYGVNPISRSELLGNVMWHFYTEGWVSVADEPQPWVRYDSPFFYGPLRGFGANHRNTDWWYYFDPDAFDLAFQLWFGTYSPEELDRLIEDTRELTRFGVRESLRVFIATNLEYFAVNKLNVKHMIFGTTTGLWSIWGIRTARTADGTLDLLEFSAVGQLFIDVWNPILGFGGIYEELIWGTIRDEGVYPHPVLGLPVAIRAPFTVETGEFEVPDDAIVYDPVEDRWVTIAEVKAAGKDYIPGAGDLVEGAVALSRVTFNYILGKWHDGTEVSLADILGNLAFWYEWAFDDSQITGEPDPFFDPEISETALGGLQQIYGIRVVDEDTIEVYSPYLDVHPGLIAIILEIWTTIPHSLLLAMEWVVLNDPEGVDYDWTTRAEEGKVGIDMLQHFEVIAGAAEELIGQPSKYLEGFPIAIDLDSRLQALIDFINARGHAVVSNGPYTLISFDPTAQVLVLEFFEDYPLGLGFIPEEVLEVIRGNQFGTPDQGVPVTRITFSVVTEEEPGVIAVAAGEKDVFLWSMGLGKFKDLPRNILDALTLVPSSSTFIDIVLNPASNIYDSNKPGVIVLRDRNITGTIIPGLVYIDADKVFGDDWVDINDILPILEAAKPPAPEVEVTLPELATPAPVTPEPVEVETPVIETPEIVAPEPTVTETPVGVNVALIAGAVILAIIIAAIVFFLARRG